jgi:hypothetical protein
VVKEVEAQEAGGETAQPRVHNSAGGHSPSYLATRSCLPLLDSPSPMWHTVLLPSSPSVPNDVRTTTRQMSFIILWIDIRHVHEGPWSPDYLLKCMWKPSQSCRAYKTLCMYPKYAEALIFALSSHGHCEFRTTLQAEMDCVPCPGSTLIAHCSPLKKLFPLVFGATTCNILGIPYQSLMIHPKLRMEVPDASMLWYLACIEHRM